MTAVFLGSIPDLPGAACVGADVDLWHAPESVGNGRGESDEARRRREAAAKAVCAACPVRAACLSWAEKADEPHGIWGGKTETERVRAPRCGTPKGARRHRTQGTAMCDPCRLAERASKTEARQARPLAAGPTRGICGTPEGRQTHRGRREKLCDACKAAGPRVKKAAPKPARRAPIVPTCGTLPGARRPPNQHEALDDACLAAEREYARQLRRATGSKPKGVAACGTTAGEVRHRRLREPVCDACREARREYQRAYMTAQRALKKGDRR
jgi:WhiB family transcriptional regulator, redox-sensing transcriptional regulator